VSIVKKSVKENLIKIFHLNYVVITMKRAVRQLAGKRRKKSKKLRNVSNKNNWKPASRRIVMNRSPSRNESLAIETFARETMMTEDEKK